MSIEQYSHEMDFGVELLENDLTRLPYERSAMETILAEAPIVDSRELHGGSNEVKIVKLQISSPHGQLAVFKGKDGEVPIHRNLRPGRYYKLEMAAYLTSKVLGLDLVPPTAIRKVKDEIGSIQQFVMPGLDMAEDVAALPFDELYRLSAFDFIIFNADRNVGNLLADQGRVRAIDNSLSFANIGYYSYGDIRDQPAPLDLIDTLAAFQADKARQRLLSEYLGKLVQPAERSACLARIAFLTKLLANQGAIHKGDLLDPSGYFWYDPRQGGRP